jgi:SP family arabinose:H+ symporter-like MFS transporter
MPTLLLATFVAALGGFLFGYDTAVISGAVGSLAAFFGLGAAEQGWVGASAIWGCLPGALAAGFLADRFGRKRLLVLCAALYALSGLWSAFPGSFAGFLASRFLGGLAIGISSMVCPTYIAELAPERRRGLLGTLFQLGIVTGIFLVFLVNQQIQKLGDPSWNAQTGWRWMLGSESLPAAVFLLLLVPAPESPRWLVLKGRIDEARAILGRILPADGVDRELGLIQAGTADGEAPFSELFAPAWRRPLFIAVALAVFCQFSGINAIMYYAPEVFKAASGAAADAEKINAAYLSSVWVGAVNLVATFVALGLIDRAGRRALLLVGVSIQTAALGAVGWMFHTGAPGRPLLVAVVTYTGAFAMAMGPIPWVLISEIFPGRIRGRAVAVGVGTIWAACLVVAQTFPLMKDRLGPAATFWIYAACSFLSLVFVAVWVPETKGRTLEEIAASWRSAARPPAAG